MRTPMRAALRFALAGWLGLAGLSLVAAQGRAATPPEKILPATTVAFVKINDAATLRDAFKQSQFGQLWNDPAMKAWKESLADKLNESSKSLKEKIGVSYGELIDLPQGSVSIAVVPRDDPKAPIAMLITADAGKNASVMENVLTKATKQAEAADSKVTTEKFRDVTLHVIQSPPDKAKDEKKDKDKAKTKDKDGDKPEPPVVWTSKGTLYFIGSDVEAVKDLVAHDSGRDDSLAANESFIQSRKKLGADAQVGWFIDVAKAIKLIAKSGLPARGGNANANAKANADQTEAFIQLLGLNGLKAVAGSFTLNAGTYDSISKTFILAPVPTQGVLKMVQMPKVSLKPEPWVPATVASYQTYSWDLDAAYKAIDDLLNQFQPGILNVLEQQLVGPNGGDPINFQKDIFGPLGDRVTVISDFKKPVTEDSQRMLIAVALEDAKAFQNSLGKLIALSNNAPKKRQFQGTTIYDFEVPDMPNPNGKANAPARQFKGPLSVAIAKNSLFIATEPTLLEQVLRGGGSTLAENSAYQAVAKELPSQVSSFSYVRPDEQARISYDMIKSGQFEKALRSAAAAGGPADAAKFAGMIDKDKMPDFSIFAKYLSQGGSYSLMEDDGVTITGFTLRKSNP